MPLQKDEFSHSPVIGGANEKWIEVNPKLWPLVVIFLVALGYVVFVSIFGEGKAPTEGISDSPQTPMIGPRDLTPARR